MHPLLHQGHGVMMQLEPIARNRGAVQVKGTFVACQGAGLVDPESNRCHWLFKHAVTEQTRSAVAFPTVAIGLARPTAR